MLRLFNKSKADSADLLKSELFNEMSFYQAFLRDICTAREYVVIESPFLTEKRALFCKRIQQACQKRRQGQG